MTNTIVRLVSSIRPTTFFCFLLIAFATPPFGNEGRLHLNDELRATKH